MTLRGDIAHRGAAAVRVHKSDVEAYFSHIKHLVDLSDDKIRSFLKDVIGADPW